MTFSTKQLEKWTGEFGRKYVGRNIFSPSQLDAVYRKMYGVTATELALQFLGKFDRNIKVLEVGSNIGNQLALLQKVGFKKLYGIEINRYAVEKARKRLKNIDIICGSAFDIPFKDGFFDLVFTAGVLIHISPRNIKKALGEIYRVTSRYIMGKEYFAEEYTPISYRGYKEMMWKGNFLGMYKNMFPLCKEIKQRALKYRKNENVDSIFLLRK